MKYLLLLMGMWLIMNSCSDSSTSLNSPSIPESLDTLYDDYHGTKLLKIRKIFRKGISYHYSAIYKDKNGEIITDSEVRLIPLAERWEAQPEFQDLVKIEFDPDDQDFEKTITNPVNKTYPHDERWTDETWEGVIENERQVWMHPIRTNQYIFTEVAPFPEIVFPLEKGKTWTGGIGGLGGWGDWDGMDISSTYEVVGQKTVRLNFGKLKVWHIEAKSIFDLGESVLNFFFHEDYGFVKMDYTNYVGQRLVFELDKITEI
jgi:hypothetical protein